METKYLVIPNSLVEKKDKDLLCAYMVAQYKCKKSGTEKTYINQDVIRVEFDFVEYKCKKIIKLLEENYPIPVYKNGLILCRDIFEVDEQFWTIGDREFDLLVGDPALFLHYVVLLKNVDEYNECTYSIEMFAELEDCSTRSISNYNTKLVELGLLTVVQRMDKSNIYMLDNVGHRYCAEAVEKYKEEVHYKVMGVQGGVHSISYKNGMLNRFIRKEIHNKVKGTIKKEYRLMDMDDLPDALVAIDKYVPSSELRDKISLLNAGLLIDKIEYV